MSTPILQSTGSTSGPGTPGQGRNDLVPGETLTLSDTEPTNVGASYQWYMLDKPIDSVAVLLNPTTATPSFIVDTADLAGSYKIRCVVDGTHHDIEIYGLPLANTGVRIPAFIEQEEYDGNSNAFGWHRTMTSFMRILDEDYQKVAPHKDTHVFGNTDPIYGDKLGIDWDPTYYTPGTAPTQVTDVDELTAHLYGIDQKLKTALGASAQKLNFSLRIGDTASHASSTPLVVSQFRLDPTQFALYYTSVSIKFKAIAGNGLPSLTTKAQIYSLTDSEYIGSGLTFTLENPTYAEETLTIGSGAGEINNSAADYEVRIWVVGATLPSELINLGSAELAVINTIT